MMAEENNKFTTEKLELAAYLYSNNVPFRGVIWPENQNYALFIFEKPPDELLANWVTTYSKFTKEMKDARNYLRDVIEGKR